MKISNTCFTPKIAALFLVTIISGRMFCLFIATPILALHISKISDFTSQSVIWFGLAMGGYGLMQLIFQIPSGIFSDSFGRIITISLGLILFVIGSIICEISRSVDLFAIGRLMQGVGAVSAASTALLADLTPVEQRFKWMAFMGFGISIAFILSFLIGPKLYAYLQFRGFFLIPAYIAAFSILILAFFPRKKEPKKIRLKNIVLSKAKFKETFKKSSLLPLLKNFELLQLNTGVFFLHSMMIGIFVAIPTILTHLHKIALNDQWFFYLLVVPPAFIGAFILVWFAHKFKNINIINSILILLILTTTWLLSTNFANYQIFLLLLLIFFFAFSSLEALQPSMVSKIAPINNRGSAMGIYHSFQSLGLFFGGVSSSFVYIYFGVESVFLFNSSLAALWFGFAAFNLLVLNHK